MGGWSDTVTTRAHLSIGEVLSLLQDEFPDITISKIRFLESQGLLDPERTPSGYRKFYEKDIERLRWILVQQRENFLPLKVIKDRLVSGELDEPTLDFTGTADLPPPDFDAGIGTEEVEFEVDTVEIDAFIDEVVAPAVEIDTTTTVSVADLVEAPAPPPPPPVEDAPVAPAEPAATPPRKRSRKAAENSVPAESAADEPTAAELGAAVIDGGESSVSLTLDELLAATGLTSRQVGELERYGLIAGSNLGSSTIYDEDALVIARLSRSFMAHGVEPRHIRSYKVAAEKEVSVFEQLVLPVLKQRDPAARQEALDTLRELAGLGEQIRGALLRQALREYLGTP